MDEFTVFLEGLTFWHWLIAALVLIIVEVILPGAIFLWMGVSAAIVGILLFLVPAMTWQWQFIIFAVISVATIIGYRIFKKDRPDVSDHPALNRRGEQYVDRTFTLAHPIEHGRGKIVVDDSTWKIEGPDLSAGANVRVTGVDGVVLKVEEEKA